MVSWSIKHEEKQEEYERNDETRERAALYIARYPQRYQESSK